VLETVGDECSLAEVEGSLAFMCGRDGAVVRKFDDDGRRAGRPSCNGLVAI
jgi:hypothetical protein